MNMRDKTTDLQQASPAESTKRGRRKLNRRGPNPLALEARLMFDGAAVDAALAVAAPADAPHGDMPDLGIGAHAAPLAALDLVVSDSRSVEAAARDTAPAGARQLVAGDPAQDGGRREIAFVDSSIDGWTQIAASISPGVEVVLIDGHADGIAQMADYLQGRSDIDAVHVIAHGQEGEATFGSVQLNADNIAQHQADLARIGTALTGEGDLLLYGCDIAKGNDGVNFIGKLADATGADVTASNDATGSASKGGDWVLEDRVGSVEVRSFDLSNAAMPDYLLGAPLVTSVDDTTYTEGSGAMVVDSNITVTGGSSYDGKYVRFSLTNGQTTDTLGLNSAGSVNTSGAISISGSSVYLGNGSGRDVIGTVDATENGTNGQALKINFVSSFTNSSFESGLTGWTVMNQRIDLGVTNIAGFVSPNDPTNPSQAPNKDNNNPSTLGTMATAAEAGQSTDGTKSAHLSSTNMTTAAGYDVVHGPAIYSDIFSASTGDAIYFDWRALAGSDAYDVYGYLLNTTTGATTQVLNATGTSSSGTTNWATASSSIPTSGNYRFVFVSGTFDFSGGKAAGASLYIDNVRVYGSKVNDAVVTSIARQVTFASSADNAVTSPTRVFTVTAMSATNASASDTGLINITAVNDAPTLTGAAQVLPYTENAAATPIDTVIVVADPDGAANFNGGYLQAQVTGNSAAEDQLSVLNQGTGAGKIGVSGSNVTYGGVSIGTIDATLNGANNTALKISLNSNATVAATQALARVISYANSSDAPSVLARTVTFTLNDGGNTGTGGALSGTRTATVNVTAVDDPTVLTMSAANAAYVENNASFYVDAGLTLVDVDSATMNGAKVIIAAGFKTSEDQLQPASGTNADGITYAYDTSKGVLTLSGTATIAQYQAALRAVKYNNTSDNPDVTPRTVTITLGNAVALTIGGVNHYYEVVSGPLSWTAAKTAAEGRTFQGLTGYLATIKSQTENDFIREKLTADAWIGASDDYTYINAATGTTTYANQAAAEGHWYWVTGPEKGTRISDSNGSPVTVSGGYAYWNSGEPNNSGSNEHYGEIYSTGASPGKWNDLPNSSTLAYVVEYSDLGGTPSFSKSITITPQRVNDAPVVSGSVALTGINEDATTNSGQLVSSFLVATDPDTDPVTGIAVTTLASSHGTWQYSLDNGASWANAGAVSNGNALLLRTTDRVRFVPDGANADTASITYRGWDRTNENGTTLKAGQKADVSTNGGTAAYSSGTQTGNIAVTAINDAPVLTAAAPTMTGINEDATSNGGQTLASILGSSVVDADSGASHGVAITSLSSGNGTWEYSINGGSTWAAVGSVAVNSALLLRDTDYVRFKPNGQNGTSASFSYKAWDRASGTQGSKVDATVGGGVTAFSTASDTASIVVTAVNDAPVLSGAALTLSGITEKNTGNAGQTVASLLGSTLSDVDAAAVQGIAITGLTVTGGGHWEYDAGSGWTTLGSASTTTAMLLRASDKIRYVPDGFKGGTASLTVLGWDTTSGSAGSTADATSIGGTTAFSTVSATASITVTDIDDAPTFTDASGTPTGPTDKTFNEAASPAAASTSTETPADTTLLLRDDGAGSTIKSATVSISAGFTSGDVLAANVSGTSITASYNANTGVLTLSGNDTAAHYQSVLRSVAFKSTNEDPTQNSATRTLSYRATDTSNLASSAITNTITVVSTEDAPVINSAPSAWSYTEDDGTRIVAPLLTLADSDDTQLSGASVTVSGTGYLNDGFELLAAVTTGTGITASFDGSTGVLTLSGTDSVANYQKVLRSVTYTNARDYNNPSAIPSNDFVLDGSTNARSFGWQVTDANSDGGNGSPAYSAQSSLVATTTVTIYNANEVPQVSNVNGSIAHINYIEGGTPATLEGLLTVQDDGLVSTINSAFVRVTAGLEAGDELGFFTPIVGWTQTGTPTSGSWDDGGGKVIAYSWSVATGDMTLTTMSGSTDQNDYTIVMQSVGFVSTSDDPTASNPTRTLIWRVTDSGGLQSAVTSSQSTIIDLTATDDAPTVAGLPADGDVVFIENSVDVVAASGLTLSDPDDTKVLNATIAISGTGFASAKEYLSLPGAVASAGSDWSVSNIGGSGIDASYAAASGTLTLTAMSAGGVDIATMQTVLRQVAYGSTDDNPTVAASTRTLTWTVTDVFGSRITDVPAGNDGDAGATSSPTTSTITLSPRNDAPIFNVVGTASDYTERASNLTVVTNATTVTDVDDALMSAATVWISAGFTPGDTLSVGSPIGLAVSYDSSTGKLDISGTASKTTYNFVLRSVRFSNSSSDDPTAISGTRTMSWSVTDANASGDGAQTSSVSTTTLNIIATDDPVTIAGLGSAGFTENGSSIAVAPSATLADLDDTSMAGLTVTIGAGRTTGDLLSVGADLTGTGIVVTSYDSSTGALVLSGSASMADYQAALRSIVFSSSSDDPAATSATRTLTWSTTSSFASRLTDGTVSNDAASGTTVGSAGSSTINITALNDAPVIALDDGTSDPTDFPTFQQGSAAVFALHSDNTSGGITISDPDVGDKIASASVAITANFLSSDVLSIVTPIGWSLAGSTLTKGGASVTFSYNSGTGILSLSGAATRSEYEALLGNVKFANGSVAPTASGASRELTWIVTDNNLAGDGARSSTGTNQLTIRDLNDSPTVNASSPSASYTEGDASVSVPTLTVTDPDPGEIVTATLTLSDVAAGGLSTPGGASYDAATGVWVLTDTVANVNAALAALNFVPATNNDVAVTISYVVADGGEDGATTATGTLTLNVTAVNDAPVLTAASPVLPTITEDDTGNAGFTVLSFRGAISDVDTGTQTGIALSSLNSGNGNWQYSLDGGSTWSNVGTVSAASSLVLRDSDRLRFVPDGQNATAGGFTYRAWDGTGGSAGSKLDASSSGNATPFSSASDAASITVTAVNDAPVMTSASPALAPLTEDDIGNSGQLVSSILGGSVSDVDSGALQGIAVTSLASGNGAWQYSLDGGSTWTAVGSVSASNALLLRASDLIRFEPDGHNTAAPSFAYKAWDRSVGTAGGTGDTTAAGSTSAYSLTDNTASVSVAAVNDAPLLNGYSPVMTSITEDNANDAGQTVASLLGSSMSDVDSGAQQGIAITGLNAGNGAWQYSLDGGSTWNALAAPGASSGLLLRDTDRVRFVPDAQNATTATLSYLAWDRSSGTAGTVVSTAVTGGASPFSTSQDLATINVTAVNDAPVMTTVSPALAPLTEDDIGNGGQLVSSILGGSVSDVDSGAQQGIAVTSLTSGNGAWQYSLDGGSTWTAVGSVSASNALLLRASDLIRFEPDGHNTAAPTFSYKAWDRSVGTAGGTGDTTAAGSTSAYSLADNTASVSVTAVNDAPLLNGYSPVMTSITEDNVSNAGQTVASLLGSSMSDVDSGAQQGIAITGLNAGNGAWQYSLDGGSTWNALAAPGVSSGLLLRDTDRVRFVPDAQNATTATLSYLAWDRSSGTAGTVVSTAVTGGTSPFSTSQDLATINVTAVNDAPINDVAPTFAGGQRGDATLRQDGVLTADHETWHDVDDGDPAVSFQYQWQVADDAAGTNLHDISGATAATYMVTAADIGKFVRVKVAGGDGQVDTFAYSTYTRVSNQDPVANLALALQETSESVPIAFTLPINAFVDADAEDTLYYTATLADGSPLPAWLTFDPITRSFSGTPGGMDTGVLSVRVTASDHGQHDVYSDFTLRVLALPVSLPPVAPPATDAAPPLAPPETPVQSSQPPMEFISDPDNAGLKNEAIDTAVPTLDLGRTDTGSIIGGPAIDAGRSSTAADQPLQLGGLTRPDGFRAVVEPSPTNDISLLLVRPLGDRLSKPSEPIRMSVPQDTFVHTQRDAVISLAATRLDGAALPAWLKFDAIKGEFQGIPPDGFDGDIEVKVTARDNFGNEVSTIFRFRVHARAKVSFSGREGLTAQLRAVNAAPLRGDGALSSRSSPVGDKLATGPTGRLPLRQRHTA